MATIRAHRTRYYKTESKFVRPGHPFGGDVRFRAGLPTLKDILNVLNKRYRKDAFDELIRLKVDQEEIGNLLQMIGVSSDEPIQWPAKKRRVKAQLAAKCRKLAGNIERAARDWPLGSRMMYSDYVEWSELPRILRGYANAWKKELKHPYRSARTPRNENILRLLEYVESKTGKNHYEKVAEILNATDAAYGWESRDGNDRWSAGSLDSINFRAKSK